MQEIYKDIKGYESLYQISNFGNVKSLKSKKILALSHSPSGYKFVNLRKNLKGKNFRVHRLVAQAFIPNPDNLPYVNHKDENVQNNYVDNLEFCTKKYNCRYGNRNKKIAEKLSKKINQYDLEGNFIKTWDSSIQIERMININQRNVCLCCKGKRKTVGGYVWSYAK